MSVIFIFPAQYEDLTTIDSVFDDEYKVAKSKDELKVILFNVIAWVDRHDLQISEKPGPGVGIMRGYMLSPQDYALLYSEFEKIGVRLAANPTEYARFHLFPNIYPELSSRTPKTIWFPEPTPIDYDLVNRTFKSFMLKDYVKSVKNEKFPKQFDTPIDAATFEPFLAKFRELRHVLFTGGFLFKEFINLKKYKTFKPVTNEHRAFFVKGKILMIHPNSEQGEDCPTVPQSLVQECENKGSPFYVVDFGELEDGSWIIIEAGDGTNAGTPIGLDLNAFVSGISQAFSATQD